MAGYKNEVASFNKLELVSHQTIVNYILNALNLSQKEYMTSKSEYSADSLPGAKCKRLLMC